MAEVIFAEGVSVFLPHEKAPDFVKAQLYINPEQLIKFCRDNPQWISEKGFIKLTIKKSQKGTLYADVDTYKATPKVEQKSEPAIDPETGVNTDDIPFN